MKDLKELSVKIDSLLESKNITKSAYTVAEVQTHEFNTEDGEFSLLRTLFDPLRKTTVALKSPIPISAHGKV